MINEFEADRQREQQAGRDWTGDTEPPPAAIPRWCENSVGDRFFSAKAIVDAARAPRLADATPPTAPQMAENPGHWAIAVSVLIRAVVLDGIPVDDPAVVRVLGLLLPVVDAEIAAKDGDDSGFP